MRLALGARAVLAIPRNIDTKPVDGVELFGSLYGLVPNDGAWHDLAEPAGVPPLQVDPTYRVLVDYVRAEWSMIDGTVPPPLTLSVLVNGAVSIPLDTLSALTLFPVAIGTPAADWRLAAELAPGARIAARARNTGTVQQLVVVFFTGWAFPQTSPDGLAYRGAA